MSDEAPKSALEIAMERLKKQDADAGVVEHKLTDEQKAAIAEARSVHEARVAELQILHRAKQLSAVDPVEIERIEQEYRRDLERLATDRDSKIKKIRQGRRMRYRLLTRALVAVARPRLRRGGGAQDDVLARIRQEGLDRSKVQALFATLTDQFGPRLAGTPAYKQSAEWARDRMREFGLTDPKLEPWPFGRGWVLDRLVIEMVEPRYMPLIGYAEAWSAPMKGEIVAAPIFLGGRPAADVAAMKDRLKGAHRHDRAADAVHPRGPPAADDVRRARAHRAAAVGDAARRTRRTRGPSRRRCARRAPPSR